MPEQRGHAALTTHERLRNRTMSKSEYIRKAAKLLQKWGSLKQAERLLREHKA